MATIVVDGMTRVAFVPVIADRAAPTAAELSAGAVLTDYLSPTGLEGFEASPTEVDNSNFGSTYGTKLPGTAEYSGTRLTFLKHSTGDTVFTTMTAFNTAGYIVIRYGVLKGTAFTAADKVMVYPVRTGTWDYLQVERNSTLKYWVQTTIEDEPVKPATVAA